MWHITTSNVTTNNPWRSKAPQLETCIAHCPFIEWVEISYNHCLLFNSICIAVFFSCLQTRPRDFLVKMFAQLFLSALHCVFAFWVLSVYCNKLTQFSKRLKVVWLKSTVYYVYSSSSLCGRNKPNNKVRFISNLYVFQWTWKIST